MNAMTDSATSRVALARALSKLGYCSRSAAVELVKAGRVTVNGTSYSSPVRLVTPGKDRIAVDGKPIVSEARIYLMMNKPRGLVTTASDEHGRQTVYSLLPGDTGWVGPVGRLDKASEGLLLLTNDTEWAANITDPQWHVEKTYHVQVNAVLEASQLHALQRGVQGKDGVLKTKRVGILRQGEKNTWLEVVLEEGKNREIRRIVEASGIEVLRLVRVAIGPLTLGQLPKGKVRSLSLVEKQQLDAAMGSVRRISTRGERTLERR